MINSIIVNYYNPRPVQCTIMISVQFIQYLCHSVKIMINDHNCRWRNLRKTLGTGTWPKLKNICGTCLKILITHVQLRWKLHLFPKIIFNIFSILHPSLLILNIYYFVILICIGDSCGVVPVCGCVNSVPYIFYSSKISEERQEWFNT